MSFFTPAPGEIETRISDASDLLEYFETYKDLFIKDTDLTMHPELFEYGDEEQLRTYLQKVGKDIYKDIETSSEQFKVGNLGSVWYDKEYSTRCGVKHLLRIGLIASFDPKRVQFQKDKYTKDVTFFINVDILDLL
jgi:hypothetical protein